MDSASPEMLREDANYARTEAVVCASVAAGNLAIAILNESVTAPINGVAAGFLGGYALYKTVRSMKLEKCAAVMEVSEITQAPAEL